MCSCWPLIAGTSRFPPSIGPLRGQAASPPDAHARRSALAAESWGPFLEMNATFQLVRTCPAPGPFLLDGSGRPRARDAADRAIADVVQRVVGDLVDRDVGPHALLVPVR